MEDSQEPSSRLMVESRLMATSSRCTMRPTHQRLDGVPLELTTFAIPPVSSSPRRRVLFTLLVVPRKSSSLPHQRTPLQFTSLVSTTINTAHLRMLFPTLLHNQLPCPNHQVLERQVGYREWSHDHRPRRHHEPTHRRWTIQGRKGLESWKSRWMQCYPIIHWCCQGRRKGYPRIE